MKKVICKVEYDTDTATLIKKRTFGCFGDPAGYEECLYRTPHVRRLPVCSRLPSAEEGKVRDGQGAEHT